MTKRIFNTIDLFAGCGGLLDGFMQEGSYNPLASVEWEKEQCETLRHRLHDSYGHTNAKEEVIRFDIQRTEELFNGFTDEKFGVHIGLDSLVGNKKVHIIIGGPPCQAYSIAGRIRDEKGMKEDYRNFLFESYVKIVNQYRPDFFIFENVQGMLTAAPDGELITDKIRKAFNNIGFIIKDDLKTCLFDVANFGIPQHRKRVIIFGVNQNTFQEKSHKIINEFYSYFNNLQEPQTTVFDAIGDLPAIYPLNKPVIEKGKRYSHSAPQCKIENHIPRFHSLRDISVFKMLAIDIETGTNKYTSTQSLKELYTEITGKKSNIHKFYVLRKEEPSNTIPAHLYKDGLRHIHPDSEQGRSITVREAARLQSFPDDFIFYGSQGAQYKMIGNAVPPKFALKIAKTIKHIYKTFLP